MGTNRHIQADELSAFFDGELSPARGASVREHLAGCGACAGSVASFDDLDFSLIAGADCAALRPLVSAFADGELASDDRRQLVKHLASCVPCQRLAEADRLLDARLAAMPRLAPSARTDAAIAAIVDRGDRVPRGIGGLRLGAPARLATVVAATVVLLLTIATLGGLPSTLVAERQPALVAAAQVVFDTRTNTLYVLDPKAASVSVLDGTTHAEQARIAVGGKPTALALNTYANTVLVLDGSEKRLTEIDTTNKTVLSASALPISGTPTSIQVDPRGQIVVASVLAPTGAAPANAVATGAAVTATGQVTVLDGASKQVKSVRTVDVAPRAVVLDPTGARALLVSAQTTTVADAATYRPLEQLPGGVAAVFDSSGSRIAILGGDDGNASLRIFGDTNLAPVQLVGAPLALISLPGGAFAVLLNSSGTGHVAVIGSDGSITSVLDAALSGRDLAYDPAADRFAVVGDGGMSYPVLPPSTAVVANAPSATPTPTPPATARPSPTPSASPSASPPPVAAASPVVPTSGPARFAALAWAGTYRLELPEGRKAVQVAGSGARIWFIDQYKGFGSINTATGKVTIAGQLPQDWNYSQLLVGQRVVVAVDQSHGRVATYDTSLAHLDLTSLALVTSARAFALAPDDRLWMGGPGGVLLAVDLSTKRVESVDVGAAMVNALWSDSAARIWYADDARKMLGSYDPSTHRLSESLLPRTGNVVSLVTDSAGTLWVGTDAGEAIPIRPSGTQPTLRIAGLLRLAVDASGRAWYFAATSAGSAFAPLSDLAGVQIAPSGLLGPNFDTEGSVWLSDAPTGGFYIVTRTAARQ